MSLIKRMFSTKGGRSGNDKRSKGTAAVPSTSQQIIPVSSQRMTSNELFKYKPTTEGAGVGDIDRTLYSMPMPDTTDAMTDLIKMHKEGDKFPYVGIVGDEGEDPDSRRSRLLAIKPIYNTRNIPEIVVEACGLINTEGEFSMQDLMEYAKQNVEPVQPQTGPMPKTKTTKDFAITKRYIHIRSITALYTPNVSSTADYCGFHIVLNDTRLINRAKCGQSNAIVSNQEGVMEMSCDYCVSVSDLGSFVLEYKLEREIVRPGYQWGTLTFYFNITETDLPFQTTKKTALAVYRMPLTTLLKRDTNADKSNVVFTPEDVNALREMFMQGDIVDVDQAQEARLKKSSYSKSTLRNTPKGEAINTHVTPGWEMMKGARKPQVDAMVASVSADSGDDMDFEGEYAETTLKSKDAWEKEQDRLRQEFSGKTLTNSSIDNSPPRKGILKGSPPLKPHVSEEDQVSDMSAEEVIREIEDKRKVPRFNLNPDTRDTYPF